jgi:hypothetical protein
VVDGKKNHSLSALYWGAAFKLDFSAAACTRESFQEALEAIYEKNTDLLAGMSWEAEGSIINLKLPFTGKKESGLQGIIASICGLPFRSSGIIAARERQYAKSPDGSGTCDYFSAFRV